MLVSAPMRTARFLHRAFWAWLVVLLAAPGCDDESFTRTHALFDLKAATTDLFAVPYPNDLRVGNDGTIDLAGLQENQLDLVELYLKTVERNALGGFALSGAVYFRFDGNIDTASLPPTPEATLRPGSAAYLVNIHKGSPEYGTRVPLRWKHVESSQRYIGEHSLALLPSPGFVLAPATTYAAILTESICDPAGDPIRADVDFERVIGENAPDDDRAKHAHTAYQPLRNYLARHGVTGVISAAVFTTGDPSSLAGRARQALYKAPPPEAENLALAAERSRYWEILGTYDAPNFQSGTPPFLKPTDGGEILLDDQGSPKPARTETLRFALSVPKGPPPAEGWPVVIFAHGTGGDYRNFITSGTADNLALVRDADGTVVSRLAVVGIDQNLHGPRAPGAAPELTFINLQNPSAAVNNVIQSGIDGFSLLRMIKQLSFDRIYWGEESGHEGLVRFEPPVHFDPDRIYFFGHSQGGITGPVFLAHEPEVKAAVLSGAGAGVVAAMLGKTAPIPFKPLIAAALGETPDEFHPMLNLMQQLLEKADTGNYGRMLLRARPQGVGPKHLLVTQGIVDHYTPNETTDALAVATGLPLAGPVLRKLHILELTDLPRTTLPLPLAGNLTVADTAVTAALVQHPAVLTRDPCIANSDCAPGDYCDTTTGRCSDDGHFVAFHHWDAVRQVSLFLATAARDGVPTVVE